MAVILLEGLDRTGKSSVAEQYKAQGFKIIHMSAPPKEMSQPGYVGPSYLDQMVEILQQCAVEDVVLDRTHYGELIWPIVYNRKPMLTDEDYEILKELEDSVGVTRILMHDPNVDSHWQRCVDNKEPLTKAQFLKARQQYEKLVTTHGFVKKTIKDFDINVTDNSRHAERPAEPSEPSGAVRPVESTAQAASDKGGGKSLRTPDGASPEQRKLELANAINSILSKRIIKSTGSIYDQLELDIRGFLNERLGRIFGDQKINGFTPEEVSILKLMVKRLNDKKESK